ncbi:MAG TPA: hypothetical protein VM096_06300 [Vicinamibacterales bacterium]|nr:hypothetical protein [Vicinamibacterales bacterium]
MKKRVIRARPAARPAAPHVVYTTPLVKKLGVKPDMVVALLSSPKGFSALLKPLPAGATFTARAGANAGLFVCFSKSTAELEAHIASASRVADRQTLWLAWPKKASGVPSDLNDNVVRTTGLAAGWVDFKVCAIDATWSALAFKRRK